MRTLLVILLMLVIAAQTIYSMEYDKVVEYMESEKFQQAVDLLKAKESELDYQGLSYLGYCYFRLEKDDIAEQYLNQSIKLNDKLPNNYKILGQIYYFAGKYALSENAFLKYLGFVKDSAEAYSLLARTKEKMKDNKSAVKYYEKALKYGANDFQTNYNLALLYFDDGKYKQAEPLFLKCDELNNKAYTVVDCLIQIKYRNKDYKGIDVLKERLRKIWSEAYKDKDQSDVFQEFTIDSFNYKDYRIDVKESFILSGMLYYHWIFVVYNKNGEFLKSVNLESSNGIRELGVQYIIGIDSYVDSSEIDKSQARYTITVGTDTTTRKRRIHQTTYITFKELPDYEVMKKIVTEYIDNGLPINAMGVY